MNIPPADFPEKGNTTPLHVSMNSKGKGTKEKREKTGSSSVKIAISY